MINDETNKSCNQKTVADLDTYRVLWIADITMVAEVMRKPSRAKRKTRQLAYHNRCFWLNV